jgi:hypothetical protein
LVEIKERGIPLPNIYRVHPAIGITRVGDSPDEYFVGPEAPGAPSSLNTPDAPHDPDAGYKDDQGRIKRQGARFRIYEHTLDDAGATVQVREITAADAQIEWEVNLANRKAAAPEFQAPDNPRNSEIEDEEERRKKLIIDAGPRRIGGAGQDMKRLQGRFMDDMDVPLGDLLTDSAGRLIVLGGFGKSRSSPSDGPPKPLDSFADNDGWCDDTSDGPVRATIRLNGSTETIEADSAWVIVAPPDFAPPIESIVTLYDVVYDMMAKFDSSLAVSDATKVSFTKDIYPILRRVSNMHGASDIAGRFHHPDIKRGHFTSRAKELSDDRSQAAEIARDTIFRALRTPKGEGPGTMPKLPAHLSPKIIPGVSLTEVQYERMRRWANGEFEADWSPDAEAEPAPMPLDTLPDMEKPHALDRAALEACVGGGFFPGIEVSKIVLDETTYDRNRLFRINAQLPPGKLTERMAVPWQADSRDCGIYDLDERTDRDNMDWWPSQRPNRVMRGQQPAAWIPSDWARLDMVEKWCKLGFVVKEDTDRYVEVQRSSDIQ